MKNDRKRKTDSFRQFKQMIFIRTVILGIASMALVYLLYGLILQGHFANWMIAAIRILLHLKYEAALGLYRNIFRNHMFFWFGIAIGLLFFLIFRIYLNWFARYFQEINRGIDMLLDEEAGEVSLSPEMNVIEKKINTVKHTLVTQKLDAQLAEQRKNDLIVYLAHDLKTPLASVIGYLNLLHDEGQIEEELREKYLSISLEKAERLEELINEFFEIAKFNLSNITLQYSRVSLNRLLEMLLYEFRPMLKEKEMECRLDIAPDTMLRCDADKLQRVFDNLLRNAVIYGYPGTEIRVTAETGEGVLTIRFSNRGDTIPADKLERIFEQFYRLDAARSTAGGGAGLGLAIAKQIVELHGGTIAARSEEETTIFEITLPLS